MLNTSLNNIISGKEWIKKNYCKNFKKKLLFISPAEALSIFISSGAKVFLGTVQIPVTIQVYSGPITPVRRVPAPP